MKRLIRHVGTGAWVTAGGILSHDLRDAVELETLSDCLEFCKKHKLKGVEIVLRFGDPRFDSKIQVSDTLIINKQTAK